LRDLNKNYVWQDNQLEQKTFFKDLWEIVPLNSSPIFIGGTGRWGTTLLRVMLNSHPNIACGPELKEIVKQVAGHFLIQWGHTNDFNW